MLHIVVYAELVLLIINIAKDPLITPVLTFLSIIVVFCVYDETERYCPHKKVGVLVRGAWKSPGPGPRATI